MPIRLKTPSFCAAFCADDCLRPWLRRPDSGDTRHLGWCRISEIHMPERFFVLCALAVCGRAEIYVNVR